jgi:hypothetical protein
VGGEGGDRELDTVLLVVTTNAADTTAVAAWLGPQLQPGSVLVANGYYAGMAALARRPRAAVVQVDLDNEHDGWRMAELRAQAGAATVAVVADAAHLQPLARPLRADVAATSVPRLPPLRELLVTDEPVLSDQTAWRRSSR